MTPEQISQIEREYGSCDTRLAEVFRLARLGLRVEAAPTTQANFRRDAWNEPTWLAHMTLPIEFGGKRVALVVLDE